MALYSGSRKHDAAVVRLFDGARTKEIDPRLDLVNHSSTGFEWGYGGGGPAQLALAMLCDYGKRTKRLTEERALELHQRFKDRFVRSFNKKTWTFTDDEIEAWLVAKEQKA